MVIEGILSATLILGVGVLLVGTASYTIQAMRIFMKKRRDAMLMKKHLLVLAIAVAGLSMGSWNTAEAALIFSHTDRSAWEAAAGGAPDFTEDFNAIPGGLLIPVSPPIVVGTLTIEGASKPATSIPSLANSPLGDQSVDGSLYILVRVGAASEYDESITFTFDTPISAFGFDLNSNPLPVGDPINFATNGSGGGTFALPATDITTEFRGFVFDTPFTSFTLTSSEIQPTWGLDNLVAFSIPEPATLGLMGLGALGMTARRRRPAR